MDFSQKRAELILYLRRFALRLGWLGAAAAVLVLMTLAEFFSVTLPAEGEVADLEAQIIRQRESSRSGRTISAASPNDVAAQISALEAFFPPVTQINQLIGDIHGAAAKERLVLERGDYRLSEEAGLDLVRYQITLPVKGNYAGVRAFLRRLLRDVPVLSLDGISLQRQSAGEDAIEAQIRVSVYFRSER